MLMGEFLLVGQVFVRDVELNQNNMDIIPFIS